jgi:lipid-binding SYLF domain-containing protein
MDVYDCILVLRDPKAVEGFFTHKFTLGAEIGIAAGPYGSGASVESGKEQAAVFSYIRSKGLYAGIEITGTVSSRSVVVRSTADKVGVRGEVRREWSYVSLERGQSWGYRKSLHTAAGHQLTY